MLSTSKQHVLQVPRYLYIVRAIQFIFALVLLCLSAWAISKLAFSGWGLTLFTALATMIVIPYIFVSQEYYPMVYNYWAILALDIFLCIFWLIAFILDATHVHKYKVYIELPVQCPGNECSPWVENHGMESYKSALKVGAIFGAFEFVLFVVTTAFTTLYLLRHRRADGHSGASPYDLNIEMRSNAGYQADWI